MRNIFAILLLTACGGESIKELPLGHEQKEKAPDPKRLEERRMQREAEAKADQNVEAAKTAALDAACSVATKPKKLDAACAAVGDAWDAFMQKRYADDADVIGKWNESKNAQLPFALTQCKKMGSIEVAACQANALVNLPLEIEAEAPEVMAHCAQKCGKDLPHIQMPQ